MSHSLSLLPSSLWPKSGSHALHREKAPLSLAENRIQNFREILGMGRPLVEGMVTHSSILAWRIPRMEEPARLQSMGIQRVGYDWVINTHVYAHAHTRMSAHREKTPRGHSKKGLFASQGERPHRRLTLRSPWSWTSSLQTWEKINFCCLKPPVHGTLLWQHWQTNTITLGGMVIFQLWE